jgi:hypothetical protein
MYKKFAHKHSSLRGTKRRSNPDAYSAAGLLRSSQWTGGGRFVRDGGGQRRSAAEGVKGARGRRRGWGNPASCTTPLPFTWTAPPHSVIASRPEAYTAIQCACPASAGGVSAVSRSRKGAATARNASAITPSLRGA